MALLNASMLQSVTGDLKGMIAILALLFALLSGGSSLPAQTTTSKEYQVKAVFLFNFAQFVEWPADAFSEAQKPLVIGVLGDDPFGAYLDEIVRGEKVNGRPLTIERYRRMEDVKTCHILFISHSEAARLKQYLDGLKSRSILTVSEINEFSRHGGMIQFVTENGKIRLRINVEAAKTARLTISSKLLRSAEIVNTGSN